MTPVKKKPNRFKKFISDNKTGILFSVLCGVTTYAVIQDLNLQTMKSFLKENNLYDEYYSISDK